MVKKPKAKKPKTKKPKAKKPCDKPRAHVVHVDPEVVSTAENQPLPDGVDEIPIEDKSEAEWAYERLVIYIQNFEEQLDNEHEIAVGFVGGDAGVLRIEGLGFFDPDIVTFYGYDDNGAKTQLIQHVTQLSVMLRAIRKEDTTVEAKRIGFRLVADLKAG